MAEDDALKMRFDALERKVAALTSRVWELEQMLYGREEVAEETTARHRPQEVHPPEEAISAAVETPSVPIAPAEPAKPAEASQPSAVPPPQTSTYPKAAPPPLPAISRPAPRQEMPETPPPPPPTESVFHKIAADLKLLPPSMAGSKNFEVEVGMWWATRIGMVLAVIALVFFGVYVSRNAGPWLRFGELSAVSVGILFLGRWLRTRAEQFGAVVFAGGLAMIYFTAFAAYAIAPVKVIDSAMVASSLQFAVVCGIITYALFSNTPVIATMAVFLGFVSSFFSIGVELHHFALLAALFLGAGAVVFNWRRGWRNPLFIAVPFTWLIFLLLIVKALRSAFILSYAQFTAYLLAFLTLYILNDLIAAAAARVPAFGLTLHRMERTPRRLVQICNTTGALVAGYLITKIFFMQHLAAFYFMTGGVLLAASIGYYVIGLENGIRSLLGKSVPQRISVAGDVLMNVYFVKGTALLTLGIVTHYHARTRWLALIVESIVLLLSAKRTRLRATEALMVVAWLAAFAFFTQDMNDLKAPFLSFSSGASFLYVLISILAITLQARWFRPAAPAPWMKTDYDAPPRLVMEGVLGALCGLAAIRAINAHVQLDWSPTALVAGFVIFAAIMAMLKRWVPLIPAAMMFVLAHGVICFKFALGATASAAMWSSTAIVLLVTIAAAAIIAEFAKRRKSDSTALLVVDAVLHFLWISSLMLMIWRDIKGPAMLLEGVGLAILLAAISVIYPFKTLADMSVYPMVLAIFLSQDGGSAKPSPMMWAAYAGALAYACAFVMWKPLKDRLRVLNEQDTYQWIHLAFAGFIGALAINRNLDDSRTAAYGGSAVLMLLLMRRPGFAAGWVVGLFLYVAGVFDLLREIAEHYPSTTYTIWATVFAFAGLAHVLLLPRKNFLTEGFVAGLRWTGSIVALLIILLLYARQTGALHNYTTVAWGSFVVIQFLAGLFLRTKELRLVALAGFIPCLLRLFIVDIHDTLHRIIACAVLSAIFMVIAWLYTKYGKMLVQLDKPE